MKITLITEGTYPTQQGGVSVWCDQLLQGLPEHDFDVYAVTGNTAEQASWTPPANVSNVELIPLWGGEADRARRCSRRELQRFAPIHEAFIETLVATEPDSEAFLVSLRAMFDFGHDASLSAALRTEETIHRLLNAWSRLSAEHESFHPQGVDPSWDNGWLESTHGAMNGSETRPGQSRPTIADAVQATALIEHFLRPLSVTPPASAVTHSVANGLGPLMAMSAKWTHGTPFILTEHGVYLRERYLAYRKTAYSRPVKAFMLRFFHLLTSGAYRIADLITPGNAYNRRWALQGGANADAIQTVYNGVDPNEFPGITGEPEAPTVSFMGRIDPIKDIETLVRSFAHVNAKMPEARLRIFGGTTAANQGYHDRCRALATELGLDDVLAWEGRVDHASTAYGAGHVVALTSISEGFPYTVVEAMISGRTTVSTDVGGVCEAVGETGLLVPPRNPEAFGEACITLLRDNERRRKLATAAQKRALEMFTLDTFLDTYRGIYQGVADGSPVAKLDPPTVIRPRPVPEVLDRVRVAS